MSQPITGQAAIFFFRSAKKNKLGRNIEILLILSLVEFCSAVSEERSKMSYLITGQGSYLVFLVGPKIQTS